MADTPTMTPDDYLAIFAPDMPSTAKEAVLPGVDGLTQREFETILRATLDNARITLRQGSNEFGFDGTQQYAPEDLRRLSSRVVNRDARTAAVEKSFDDLKADPDNEKAQQRFLQRLESLTRGEPIPADLRTDKLSALIQGAGPLNIGTGGQSFAKGTSVVPSGENIGGERGLA